ncbi:MAG: Ig-like domain-containing protein [Oscillospiraceae bacterium]|nr:Ig-like domain-containing protein [Oscillospiraceae bacterium]
MKRLLKKIAAIVATAAVAVSAFVLPTTTASAKGPFDGAVKMEFMEYYVHNFQSKGEIITYRVDIKKRGTLKMRCLNRFNATETRIYNVSGDLILDNANNDGYHTDDRWNVGEGSKVEIEKPGTYYIQMKARYDNVSVKDYYINFTPTDKPTIAFKLTMKKGTSVSLGAVTENYDGKVTWLSTKKTVAAVSTTGKVTAKKAGTTTIRASLDNGEYIQITVKVTK